MYNRELVLTILYQILEASGRIERRFLNVKSPDDFLKSDDGIDRLDAICMMLIAIGESLKYLDKITDGKLLEHYPDVDWKGAKGIRDIISHHYFDVDAEIIFSVCQERLPILIQTIQKMKGELK
ncbi:MAG TPA: HepT-like ribonuclease domain-containing protein [Bacillota bacterium]|nr:HepT-like ribonuclease domain-containing protein [Bacillota bacterium]